MEDSNVRGMDGGGRAQQVAPDRPELFTQEQLQMHQDRLRHQKHQSTASSLRRSGRSRRSSEAGSIEGVLTPDEEPGSEGEDQCRCRTLLTELSQMSYKSEICHKHVFYGHCSYGSQCQFAHGLHELRPKEVDRRFKTTLCANWHVQGYCNHGKRCKFLHDEFRVEASPGEFLLVYPRTGIARVGVQELVPLTDTRRLAILRQSIREREALVFPSSGWLPTLPTPGTVDPDDSEGLGGSWMQSRLRHSISRGSITQPGLAPAQDPQQALQLQAQFQLQPSQFMSPQPVYLVQTPDGMQPVAIPYLQQWAAQVPGADLAPARMLSDWLPIPGDRDTAVAATKNAVETGYPAEPFPVQEYETAMSVHEGPTSQQDQQGSPGLCPVPETHDGAPAQPSPLPTDEVVQLQQPGSRRLSQQPQQPPLAAQQQPYAAMQLIPAYMDPYTGQLWPLTNAATSGHSYSPPHQDWTWAYYPASAVPVPSQSGEEGIPSETAVVENTSAEANEGMTSTSQSRRPSATTAQNMQTQLLLQQQQPPPHVAYPAYSGQQAHLPHTYYQLSAVYEQETDPHPQRPFQPNQRQRRRYSASSTGGGSGYGYRGGGRQGGGSGGRLRASSFASGSPEAALVSQESQQLRAAGLPATVAEEASNLSEIGGTSVGTTQEAISSAARAATSTLEAQSSAPSPSEEPDQDVEQEPRPRSPAARRRIDNIFKGQQQHQGRGRGGGRNGSHRQRQRARSAQLGAP